MTDNKRLENTQAKSRDEIYAKKYTSKIWLEEPDPNNPYIAKNAFLSGYDFFELVESSSLSNIVFLLIRGDLPNSDDSAFFEYTCKILMNPGPRHPAAKAAIQATVGKTDVTHVLPIALSVMGGQENAAGIVPAAMKYVIRNYKQEPSAIAAAIQKRSNDKEDHLWSQQLPGYGQIYGSADTFARNCLQRIVNKFPARNLVAWAAKFSDELAINNAGILMPGVAAACFAESGFSAKQGAALFQLICAPGLLAHGLEYLGKPTTAVPFTPDEDYFIEGVAGDD